MRNAHQHKTAKAKLERFTLDRMVTILGKLDDDIAVRIDLRPRSARHSAPVAT